MQNVPQHQSLFSRDDTFLGICEGLGQDLGFHPNFLRVTLACLCFFYPVPVLATYFGLGVLVFATRWMVPNVVEIVEREAVGHIDAECVDEDGQRLLPLAA